MSKHNNVNPDHYKAAGRERPGENVIHEVERREAKRVRQGQSLRQTSLKAGSRSTAQKEAGARHPDDPAPSSRKVSGAFGREGNE
jgi:hypothetical protein